MSRLRPFDKIEIVRKCTQLSITQKLILLVIASHLGSNELCYLSLSTLQKECCISQRTALVKNLNSLIAVDILWKLPPGDGFKSNRYGINFDLLVSVAHQCGNPRLLEESPTLTSLVSVAHPKRNIKENIKEIEKEPFVDNFEKAKKARQEIRKTCNLRRH